MSRSDEVCNDFAKSVGDEKKTLFFIKSNSAKPVSKFTVFPSEQEYILLPGTQLKIINKTIDPNNKNLNIVRLKEIDMIRDGKYNTYKILMIHF
jgi:hypothetical protein